MAGRGRNRMPEIRRGQGECRSGPDRSDFRSRGLRRRVSAQGRSARREQQQLRFCRRRSAAARQCRQPAALADLATAAAAASPYPKLPAPARLSRQPAYGAPSNGPVSLTAPGVAPQEDEIDLPPEGTPAAAARRAALSERASLSAARPLRGAVFAASLCRRRPRKPLPRLGPGPMQGNSGRRRRAGRGEADRDAGLSDRLGARSLAGRFRAAGRDALVRRARRRDQADLRLFLPRHERQCATRIFPNTPSAMRWISRRSRSPTAGAFQWRTAGRACRKSRAFCTTCRPRPASEFTTVLAPGSNVYHYNHIHVDLMRRAQPADHLPAGRCFGRGSRRARGAARNPYASSREPFVTGSLGKTLGRSMRKARKTSDRRRRETTRREALRHALDRFGHAIAGEEHPRRAFDHLRDSFSSDGAGAA